MIFSIFVFGTVGNFNDANAQGVCQAGFFSSGGQCIPCPPGSVQPSPGVSFFCIPCQAGTFAALPGQTQCNQCPAGQTSNQGATMCFLETSIIGGEIIPIESASLLLAGSNSYSWMIAVAFSVLAVGLFVVSKRK